MRTIKTQFATSHSADFEENTWSFLMPEGYEVVAGEFAIVDKPVFDEMSFALKDTVELLEELAKRVDLDISTIRDLSFVQTINKAKKVLGVEP